MKSEIFCRPVGEPTKKLGPEGASVRQWIFKSGDKQTMRMEIDPNFSWRDTVKPILPGCPDWCPATHFGYLESGQMDVEMQDGTKLTVKAGDSYLILPGHVPDFSKSEGSCVMVEFAQDTTYTNKEIQEKMK